MGHRNTSREKARRRHRHHRVVMVALGHRLVTMRLMGPHPIPILRRSGGVDWNEWVYPDPGSASAAPPTNLSARFDGSRHD